MAVITFMSDFGTEDHYVAAVKGKILSGNPDQQVIDISHAIKPYDISNAAVVLAAVFRDFPEGTIHLVAVDSLREAARGITVTVEGHHFIGFDCGLFSMISNEKPTEIAHIDLKGSTFPVREVLVDAALALAKGHAVQKVGKPSQDMVRLLARQLKVTKREIVGNVVNIDHYGNLITNIAQEEFEKIVSLNGKKVTYAIRFGREQFRQLHHFFTDVDSGDCFVLFNSTGYLQIGINKGNASQLLGLGVDAPVYIEFST